MKYDPADNLREYEESIGRYTGEGCGENEYRGRSISGDREWNLLIGAKSVPLKQNPKRRVTPLSTRSVLVDDILL
jgi:hypothetical protein